MSLRYLYMSGLLTLSLVAQTPATPQSGEGQNRTGSDRTTSRTDQDDHRGGAKSSQADRNTGASSGASSLSSADRLFIVKAGQGGKTEVELGQLAVQQGSSEAVKNYGQRLVTDHTNANKELMEIASQKGVQIPDAMEKEKNKLAKMQGAAFDRAFMQHAIKDHQKDIAMFEKEANSGSDPDVKAFAAKTLPTLREHLEQARSIANNSGAGATSRMDKNNKNSGSDATGRDSSQSSLDPSGRKGKQQ